MLIGIDQGTSGTTVCAYDGALNERFRAYRQALPSFPQEGWCEHDPLELEQAVIQATAEVLHAVDARGAPCGFANQGESVLGWDRFTLEPITSVLVWNDTRAEPLEAIPQTEIESTGLRASAYFCAPKYRWLLQNVPRVGEAQKARRLALGTTETWLLARLGCRAATDDSTASRSLLYDVRRHAWEATLAQRFDVPLDATAPILPSLGMRGTIRHPAWRCELPVCASLVDQPAALAGHGLFHAGDTKITYGTGAFVVVNVLHDCELRVPGLFTSVAWSDGTSWTHAVDGGVFSAGSAVQWGVDQGIARNAHELLELAPQGDPARAVFFIPALHGLGAPWWDRAARAQFCGDTEGATKADLARAIVDGILLRVTDIVRTLQSARVRLNLPIRVDGGLAQSRHLVQRQADLLGVPLELGETVEATARGAAVLAGVGAGMLDASQVRSAPDASVEPRLSAAQRERNYNRWLQALMKVTRAYPAHEIRSF